MITAFAFVAGGIGLFLAGMLNLTEGLRALAGGTLRKILAKYTKSPLSGVFAGALTTALIQSSSATTVTAVGFVGAGLLSFSQSLGIIFGANIGTTLTGWLVAILGFKVKLGMLVLPFVLLGVVLRIYGRGKSVQAGWALVGFSLLFVGISTMQQGAAGLESFLSPSIFPPDTMFGRLQLVLIGAAVTLLTQSSSAGVATAMVALASGAISFPQAAAMVIGMDVGTTFTAALATVGGSTPMRRTGYAHVIYNMMTGIMAFFMLGPVAALLGHMALTGAGNAPVGLAVFHTFFNIVGVVLVLPFTKSFARLMKWLVEDEKPALASMLDKQLFKEPAAAADAAIFTVHNIRDLQFTCLEDVLARNRNPEFRSQMVDIDKAIRATRAYIGKIRAEAETTERQRLTDAMHALDHLRRLHRRCLRDGIATTISRDWRLQRLSRTLRGSLFRETGEPDGLQQYAARLYRLMHRQDKLYRVRLMREASGHGTDGEGMLQRLDSMRWLLRVSYHVWRIRVHTNN